MTSILNQASAVALAVGLAFTGLQAQAADLEASQAADYHWRQVGPVGWSAVPGTKNSPNTRTAVKARLMRAMDGLPARADRTLLATADMAPDGMPEMTTTVRLLPEADATLYRVALKPVMAGRWALHLAAQPTADSAPVPGTMIVTLTD